MSLLFNKSMWYLLYNFFAFGENQFDVAWVGHVRIDLKVVNCGKKEYYCEWLVAYPAMSAICTSPLFRSLVDLDVLDDEIAGVEAFGICIRFCVLKKTEEEFGGFNRPTTFRGTECFSY